MKKENQVEETKKKGVFEKAKERHERFQLIMSLIGAIFFAVSIIMNAKSNFAESPLFPIVIVFAVGYVLVFLGFIVVHFKNKDNIKNDTTNFKNVYNIIKLVMNLLFIVSSLLIFIMSISEIGSGIIAIIQAAVSGLLLLFKLISTIRKLLKNVKKTKKTIQKQKEAKEKENNK